MFNWQSVLSRRDFIRVGAAGGLCVLMSSCLPRHSRKNPPLPRAEDGEFLRAFGPVDRTLGEVAPQVFSGDDNRRAHAVLWRQKEYLASRQVESEEHAEVVVVGGGASGLFSAYALRNHNPIVLEQAPRLGGNAKGQSWRGVDYGIGSAYIDMPTPGSPFHALYEELSLASVTQERAGADPILYNGAFHRKFWEGETDASNAAKYKKLAAFFAGLNSETERAFPLIPSLHAGNRESVRHYDQWSLHELLSKEVGGLSDHLETAIEHYCWSTYAASSSEISAAAVLNFLAQESDTIRVGAAGNASIVEQLLRHLLASVPSRNLRPKSLVVQVKVEGDKALVLYEDPEGKLRSIRAKMVVMSCPKFVALRILDGIESERIAAIKALRYRSYMLANVLVKKKMKRGPYDVFSIATGKADLQNIRKYHEQTNATDFVMANFGNIDANFNVLTLFNAFPFDGARDELNKPGVYEKYKKRFEAQITQSVLPLYGLTWADVADLRLTLWGHALPVAAQGIYTGNVIDQLRKPFKDRVFFVEQDNWAYPSIHTGATEVALLKDQMLAVLRL